MKKIIPSILLFLALSSQLGTFMVYLIQQEIIKENIILQISQNIPKQNLIKLALSSKMNWEEENKEFSLNGIYYDIVSSENINGTVWLYCINDSMETKLINQYANDFKHNLDTTPIKKDTKQHIKFPTTAFDISIPSNYDPFLNLSIFNNNFYKVQFNSLNYEIETPPPRLV